MTWRTVNFSTGMFVLCVLCFSALRHCWPSSGAVRQDKKGKIPTFQFWWDKVVRSWGCAAYHRLLIMSHWHCCAEEDAVITVCWRSKFRGFSRVVMRQQMIRRRLRLWPGPVVVWRETKARRRPSTGQRGRVMWPDLKAPLICHTYLQSHLNIPVLILRFYCYMLQINVSINFCAGPNVSD